MKESRKPEGEKDFRLLASLVKNRSEVEAGG